MKISIIGAGNIGSTLARKLTAAGHSIRIANSRGPETLKDVAAKTGATAATVQEALQDVDVVVLSVPLGSLPRLRESLVTLPLEVIVADTSNYYPFRDGHVKPVDDGQVESLWVSVQIGRPVVKAWNNILAGTFADRGLPVGIAGRIALSVAGDNPAAKQVVMSLVSDTGFDAIDGGSLAESWRQQPGTPAYCTELTAGELRTALTAAERGRAPLRRDQIMKEIIALGEKVTTETVVRLNRTMAA